MTVLMNIAVNPRSDYVWIAPPMGELVSACRTLLAFRIPPVDYPNARDVPSAYRITRTKNNIRVPSRMQCWWKGDPMPGWLAFPHEPW